jgi:hypothetical protein
MLLGLLFAFEVGLLLWVIVFVLIVATGAQKRSCNNNSNNNISILHL